MMQDVLCAATYTFTYTFLTRALCLLNRVSVFRTLSTQVRKLDTITSTTPVP